MLHVDVAAAAAVTDACKKCDSCSDGHQRQRSTTERQKSEGTGHRAQGTEEAANANTFRVLRNLIKSRTISAKAFYNIAKQLI